MQNKHRALTLTECLVTILFIATLAAIAVPNFHHAQVRSKLAKAMLDLRALGKATEAYGVDRNAYPSCVSGGIGSDYIQPFVARMHPLTTPIAYLAKVLEEDPFRAPGTNRRAATYIGSYEYYDSKGASIRGGFGGDIAIFTLFEICAGMQVIVPGQPGNTGTAAQWNSVPKWLFQCVGPDGYEDFQFPILVQQDWANNVVFYDPTNGAISKGDIFRSQFVSSFK